MTLPDWLILGAFVVYAIFAGLRTRRLARRSLDDYFLAGRSLRGWQAGISMAATQFAADTPLLVTGMIALGGVFSLWRLWIYALAFLLLGFVLGPCWRRAGVLTDAALVEQRYSGRPASALRAVKAVYFGTVFNCTVLAMVLFAAREIAEPFLHWSRLLPPTLFEPLRGGIETLGLVFARELGGDAVDLWTRSTENLISIGAIALLTMLYSATGGLRAVVRTDLVQLAIMLVGTAGYALWVLHEVGGTVALSAQITALYSHGGPGGILPSQILAFTPDRARDLSYALVGVLALQWLVQMNADGTGYLAQRTMACRSDRDAKQAAVVFTGVQILLRSLLWLPIGVGLLVLFPVDPAADVTGLWAEREASFVRGIAELLPAGLRGLMLTAMLAALASTVDTHLNWGASYWTHDLYDRFLCRGWLGREPSERSLVRVARLSNLGILALSLVVMIRLSSIQLAWQLSLLLGAGMGVPLVLRWLWWRLNAWGELGAILASLALAPVLLVGMAESPEALRLLLMACGATLVGVAASLVTAPVPDPALRAFYARVRPPGFWGPVARALGREPAADRRILARGLAATGLAALSVFALLTAAGSWLIGSPAPVVLDSRPLWIGSCAVLGIGLIPVWWRLGLSEAAEPTHGRRSERD
ncbi:MAG: sodium:solute symporter family protein [Myxococcota bacterium]